MGPLLAMMDQMDRNGTVGESLDALERAKERAGLERRKRKLESLIETRRKVLLNPHLPWSERERLETCRTDERFDLKTVIMRLRLLEGK